MNFPPQMCNSGGVAERLIAPVLKTGRPQGLVSSNLTPSAWKVEDFQDMRWPVHEKREGTLQAQLARAQGTL